VCVCVLGSEFHPICYYLTALFCCAGVAPTPRSKANRVLKTAIPSVNSKSLPGSVGEPEVFVQGTKEAQSARVDAFAAVEGQRHTTVTMGATPEARTSTD
jgi:hypothetical protein